MLLLLLLPRLLLLLAAASVDAQQQQPQPLASGTDLAGLYSLRGSLGLRARDWPARSDPCSTWTGVTCRAGRVVSLTVAGLRRTRRASLAPRLALDGLRNLTALQRFNASGFPLPGEIPAWFSGSGSGLPPPLAVLDLTSAGVNGTLPAGLGASSNLTTILLAGNRISGPLPAPLLSVNGIRVLDLSRNNLTGELPNISSAANISAAGPSSSLFNISGNSLYGVAGDAVRALSRRFQVVDVSGNYLDGPWTGSASDGNGTVVLATMNCFSGAPPPGQRGRAECEEFYRNQGVRLVDAPAPSPSLQPLPVPVKGKKQRISRNVLIGVIVAAGTLMILFLLALAFCLMGRRRRRGRGRGAGRGIESNEEGTRSGRRRDSSVNPVASSPSSMSPRANAVSNKAASSVSDDDFTFEQLVHATGGFGDDNLLKHGHSGDIYHAILETGSHVVVKKVGTKSGNKHTGELDFYKRYTHVRIVPLLGHFAMDDDVFLAYKYMPKGDLTGALHKKPAVDTQDGLPSLDWITRLKIATGVAEAMCFLHDECSPPLVHRDIQASSVLLDDKFEVRLGSMSEICAQQSGGSQSVFSRILRSSKSLEKHTSGPPATCSYDVHCFGKVLLELVTGNFSISGPSAAAASDESSEWLMTTLSHISSGDKSAITNIIDPLLVVDEDHLEEVWAVAIIAKTCLSSKPSRRPSARYVLRALENPLRGNANGGRVQSFDVAALDRRHSARSFGSGGGGGGGASSFSFRRAPAATTPDIVPEPTAPQEGEEDGAGADSGHGTETGTHH
ncbi:hypothetical protein PR202_gb12199 [Eleusine coracana subsp. coracana]|uniref:Protein kinase domain-containing protein n=1 Tax=Eleusine coracana subsp. coracana TaxID=191504 RepID=A0AAV5EMF8_ELECO|nr:hypothetical protein PR202_gb12199 [Eleusine coracana subsp. coracana]